MNVNKAGAVEAKVMDPGATQMKSLYHRTSAAQLSILPCVTKRSCIGGEEVSCAWCLSRTRATSHGVKSIGNTGHAPIF